MTGHIARRIFRLIEDATGVNLIEAAIITPLLLVTTFAVVDFGAMFYVYLALENGVSQATRFAVTGNQMSDPDKPGAQRSRLDSIKEAMRQATPTLTISDSAFSFSHLSPGGNSWAGGTGGPNDIEKVTVDYTWNVLTPFLRPFFEDGRIRFRVESAMKNEGRFN